MKDRARSVSWFWAVPLVVGLFGASPATAAVIWKADFETGNISQWMGNVNATVAGRKDIEIVTTPAQQGTMAGKLTIHPDDLFGGTQMRVQLDRNSPRTGEGQDLYMSFYFLMQADPGIRDNIAYFESTGSNRNMMTWWLAPKTGGGSTVNYGTGSLGVTKQWTADFTLNQWHQMAMHIHWSASAANGQVQLWYDGAMVLDIKVQTKADANSMSYQTGIHRASRSTFVDSVFLDNYVEGDSLADIMIAPPGSNDGGVTDAGTSADAAADSGPISGGGSGGATEGAGGVGPSGSGGSTTSGSGGAAAGTGGSGVTGVSASGGCALVSADGTGLLSLLAPVLFAGWSWRRRRCRR